MVGVLQDAARAARAVGALGEHAGRVYTYAAKAALDAARDALEDEGTYVFSDVAVRARQGVREDVGRFVQALAPRAGAL